MPSAGENGREKESVRSFLHTSRGRKQWKTKATHRRTWKQVANVPFSQIQASMRRMRISLILVAPCSTRTGNGGGGEKNRPFATVFRNSRSQTCREVTSSTCSTMWRSHSIRATFQIPGSGERHLAASSSPAAGSGAAVHLRLLRPAAMRRFNFVLSGQWQSARPV
jgi:hypothetical protein